MRVVGGDRIALCADGSAAFTSHVEEGWIHGPSRPVIAGDITHACGGSLFGGYWPRHEAKLHKGALWWFEIGSDAR